jgi:hypothetical protein
MPRHLARQITGSQAFLSVVYNTSVMRLFRLAIILLAATSAETFGQQIILRSDITFSRDDGSRFTIRRGTTLDYVRTHKLFYVVHSDSEGELAIPERIAAESHKAFTNSVVEARFVEIAAELRSREVVPTTPRVMAILNKELRQSETNQRLERIERKLDELED